MKWVSKLVFYLSRLLSQVASAAVAAIPGENFALKDSSYVLRTGCPKSVRTPLQAPCLDPGSVPRLVRQPVYAARIIRTGDKGELSALTWLVCTWPEKVCSELSLPHSQLDSISPPFRSSLIYQCEMNTTYLSSPYLAEKSKVLAGAERLLKRAPLLNPQCLLLRTVWTCRVSKGMGVVDVGVSPLVLSLAFTYGHADSFLFTARWEAREEKRIRHKVPP